MSKEDIIDLLIDSVPEIREAFNFQEEVEDRVYSEEIIATYDELYRARTGAAILREAVETEAQALVKQLDRAIRDYERVAIR